MIKIGYFSRISQVPVKTLRYYDEMGLLKPVEVDRFTGYRYYSFDQLTRLNRILALKDLGFSLDQISRLLVQDLPISELRGMLKMRQEELRQHVQGEMSRLERVEARLKQIEQETSMANYDIVLKKVDPIWVAGVREMIPSYPEQGHLWEKLESYLLKIGETPTGACFTIYHSEEPEIDAEVCEPLSGPIPAVEPILVHQLPGVECIASVIHHGPFTTLNEAYSAVLKWIETNGYRCTGPVREIYLEPPPTPGSQTDPNTVTEIQFQVEKA
jgi:DNA-binding transcriptional MerR regulator